MGSVIGVAAGRGLVTVTRGTSGMASIWTELVATGLAIESTCARGWPFTGCWISKAVASMKIPVQEALARYEVGAVVLSVTRSVERALCVVEVFPDFPVGIETDDVVTSSRPVDLRTLITEGEVVVARIVERGESPEEWRCR